MRNIYCTYFNSGYLDRAVVLIKSMRQFDPGFRLEVLCFDDAAFEFIEKHPFPEVSAHRLQDFESRNQELVQVKPSRSVAEYFFTCTSVWTSDVASRNMDSEFITYLDCDMRFYSSPKAVFELMADKDILICPHYYSRDKERMERYGKYNVGWLTFRTNDIGMDCLKSWRQDCLEWCYEKLENTRYADQKYLDYWPAKYRDRLIEGPIELDLGPWGIKPGALTLQEGVPCIEGKPIILYHFQGLRLYSDRHYYIGHCFHQPILQILKTLYEPYICELIKVKEEFGLADSYGNSRRRNGNVLKRMATGYWLGHPYLSEILRRLQRIAR